jgi:tRNA A37 N6-isopentenylltransferase MiaA
MTSHSELPIKKKRGRPAKKMQVGDTTTFKQLNAEAAKFAKKEREMELLREHAELLMERTNLKLRVSNLEHQAIGYRAVISYLEHQFITTLGSKK